MSSMFMKRANYLGHIGTGPVGRPGDRRAVALRLQQELAHVVGLEGFQEIELDQDLARAAFEDLDAALADILVAFPRHRWRLCQQ